MESQYYTISTTFGISESKGIRSMKRETVWTDSTTEVVDRVMGYVDKINRLNGGFDTIKWNQNWIDELKTKNFVVKVCNGVDMETMNDFAVLVYKKNQYSSKGV
jgi:hypothetical protein